MTQTPDPVPVSDLTYEQARDELVALVARIESGTVPLEESMMLWERGEQLAAHCQAKLDAAQESLDRATAQTSTAGAPASPGEAASPGGAAEAAGTGGPDGEPAAG
jgi:exodeoxyribonuclease VII small subunit